jgi:drug/metabolite transporter (DMT)-like permease
VLAPVVFKYGLKAGRTGYAGSLALATLLGFPYVFVLANGLRAVPAAHGALFTPGVYPVITLLLGVLILKDRITRLRLGGIALIAAGVGAVGWTSLAHGAGEWQGYAMFLLCAWMWAGYTICARLAGIGALHITAIVSVLSLVLFVPVYAVLGDISLHKLPLPSLLFQLTFQGLGNGLIAMFSFTYAVRMLGAAQAAAFGALVPCFALVLSAPIAGEIPTPVEAAGVVAVAFGIMLVNGLRPWPRRRRANLVGD